MSCEYDKSAPYCTTLYRPLYHELYHTLHSTSYHTLHSTTLYRPLYHEVLCRSRRRSHLKCLSLWINPGFPGCRLSDRHSHLLPSRLVRTSRLVQNFGSGSDYRGMSSGLAHHMTRGSKRGAQEKKWHKRIAGMQQAKTHTTATLPHKKPHTHHR